MSISIEEKQGQELDQFPMYTMPVVATSVAVLVVTLLVGGALMWMDYSQAAKVSELNDQISVIEMDIAKKDADGDVFAKAERMSKATKIFDDFVSLGLDWNMFLNKMSDITLSEVTYTSFIVDREERSFNIDGVAPSYRIIAEQLYTFNNDESFESVNLTTAVLRPDSEVASRVAFSLELKPAKDAFLAVVEEEDVFDLIGDEELVADEDVVLEEDSNMVEEDMSVVEEDVMEITN